MDIWKGNVRGVVTLKDTWKPINGLDEKWATEEKRSATSLMILSHLMIKRFRHMHTKRKKFKCVLCQSEWKENHFVLQHKIDISALIVWIG